MAASIADDNQVQFGASRVNQGSECFDQTMRVLVGTPSQDAKHVAPGGKSQALNNMSCLWLLRKVGEAVSCWVHYVNGFLPPDAERLPNVLGRRLAYRDNGVSTSFRNMQKASPK